MLKNGRAVIALAGRQSQGQPGALVRDAARPWEADAPRQGVPAHGKACAALGRDYDPLRDDEPELARTIAFGERAGHHVRRIGPGCGYAGERPALTGPCYARVHGFSLHANTGIPAPRRDQLERLIRYTGRGAVSLERLAEDAHGDLVYTFSRPWSDGTTGITLSPWEFLEKLAALVPLPRVHLVRYAGCLAPHSARREAMIPTPRQQGVEEQAASTASPPWS